MAKDYFEQKQEENKNILLQILKSVFSGILFISSLRIEKNMMGGYRLVAFISERKKDG